MDLERPTSISLEGELVCLQKMINHQLQEMSATMEKTLCSLIEQQKLSEMDYLEQKQQITKLVAEVAELKEKNQTLLKEKHQLLEVCNLIESLISHCMHNVSHAYTL